ncbi:hypothetical protein KXD40_004857 [Peronospora effusa]|uniref:Uncharacterized protein n=1 Tax=Peronospora effusa TaxID=542832 RepID=A0A3M6VAX8_9STRA|nr:hypothetical protein DD238_007805 [Peronospora effusa]UIZ22294.1 hypothetical protein KXD40_004857 [Peronospora effusa]
MNDDVVYASILTRMGHSELQEPINKVMEKELTSLDRHVRHASSSLMALRQLQAAAGHLRPSGDWLPRTLSIQLQNIIDIQCQFDTMVNDIEMNRKTKKRKRSMMRRTIEKKDKDEIVIGDEEKTSSVDRKMNVERIEEVNNDDVEVVERDKSEGQDNEESNVEGLQIESVGEMTEMERAMEYIEEDNNVKSETVDIQQEHDDETNVMSLEIVTADEGMAGVENVELEIPAGCGDKKLDDMKSESDKLLNGLLSRPLDAIEHLKDEPVTFDDVQALSNDEGRICKNVEAATKIVESPLKLEVKDSLGIIAVKLEVPELTELALELEVPDSDTDDEFSPIQELVAKLEKVKGSTQLVRFPAAVDQLRTYLFDRKYLTVTGEVDGYLFAHKHITDEEANVIGHTIEKIISVAINLPKRATIKFALYDLLATVEQLELTLGELPEFLRL